MSIDRAAAARAIRLFLEALGHDPSESPELAETPERVAEAFEQDLLSGYGVDLQALVKSSLSPVDAGAPPGIVVVRDIAIATVCPHHLLPALGTAVVAYQPGTHVLGIGTVARLVDALARRLTLQETVGLQVTETLCARAGARGAYCRLELVHSCLAARGARQAGARVITVATRGEPLVDLATALAEPAQ
jgi:GTP cyclohydrolase I